jgi:hypothetical protein
VETPITMRTTLFLASLASALHLFAQDSLNVPGPRISFDHVVHQFGKLPHRGDGRCVFTFTNTGDSPLIIAYCQSSCGCVVPSWDKEPVAPGATGRVRVLYDTQRVGPFVKSVTVNSNAVDRPVLVLTIRGEVALPPVVPDTLQSR